EVWDAEKDRLAREAETQVLVERRKAWAQAAMDEQERAAEMERAGRTALLYGQREVARHVQDQTPLNPTAARRMLHDGAEVIAAAAKVRSDAIKDEMLLRGEVTEHVAVSGMDDVY